MRFYPLLLIPLLGGCVAYPKVYWRTLKGTARIEDGKPVTIKAAVVKMCESMEGEAEFPGRERETTTDAKGQYRLGIHAVVMHTKNFYSLKHCTSRLQLYVCRQYCREADQVDIDVLGK